MRCVTLAEAVAARGGQARFVCRLHDGHLVSLIRSKGFEVLELPAPAVRADIADADYPAWLGVTQERDAEETIQALRGRRADWLVVDHYSLDATWERRLRSHADRLLVITDLTGREHECDVLLNQNYGAERGAQGSAGANHLLLGSRYALLRPEFAAARERARLRDGTLRRVLVFFGGTDPANLTALALDALCETPFTDVEADILVGANNSHAEALAAKAAMRPGTRIHRNVADMAALMARADFAVGAGGTTTLERLCLGLPSIVVSIAGNQLPACEALAHDRLIVHLRGDGGGALEIGGALRHFVAAPAELADMSARSRLAVDGLGAERMLEMLEPTPIRGPQPAPGREWRRGPVFQLGQRSRSPPSVHGAGFRCMAAAPEVVRRQAWERREPSLRPHGSLAACWPDPI